MAPDYDAVALLDFNAEGLAQARDALAGQGIDCHARQCDVTDAGAMEEIAARVEAEIGPVSAVVASAGILNNSETVLGMDLGEHRRVWEVNYDGTVHTVRAFAGAMTERKAGSIVTLGSITGLGAFPLPAYSPGKAALVRLTEILAVELGRFGLRVNGVAPTYVVTPNLQARIDAGERDPDVIRKAGALEMFVRAEHIADAVAFLCSPQAAAITGAMLPVDAGWHAATVYRSYAGGVPWEKDRQA